MVQILLPPYAIQDQLGKVSVALGTSSPLTLHQVLKLNMATGISYQNCAPGRSLSVLSTPAMALGASSSKLSERLVYADTSVER